MWPWSKPRTPRSVILYTREGCHLCDDAYEVLAAAGKRFGFAVEVVDIAGDAALEARYGLEIPVAVIDGEVRFRGAVNRVLLERLLRARE